MEQLNIPFILILCAIFLLPCVVIVRGIQSFRKRKQGTKNDPPPILFEEYPPHPLGTTNLNPGDIPRIRHNVTVAAREEERLRQREKGSSTSGLS
jgi:hypothetical protein